MSTEPISDLQLALAAGLMLVSLLVSWRLRLGLHRDIAVASVRMTVQLLLVGLILNWALTPGLGHVESSSGWRKRDDQDHGQEELLR